MPIPVIVDFSAVVFGSLWEASPRRIWISPVLTLLLMAASSSPGLADELAPLGERPDLVQVAEPLPDSQSLVVPQEPFPQPETERVELPLAPFALEQATEEVEIIATVDRWLVAWWQQQADDYLSFYSEDFKVPEELNRKTWEEHRRTRLAAPSFIAIRIEAQEIIALSENDYRAQFIQHYRSDTFQDTVLKVLDLTREDGRWKILREESKLPTLPSTQAKI